MQFKKKKSYLKDNDGINIIIVLLFKKKREIN